MLIVITFIFTSDPMAIVDVDPMAIADGNFPTSMVIFHHRCLLYDNQLNRWRKINIDVEKSTATSQCRFYRCRNTDSDDSAPDVDSRCRKIDIDLISLPV